MSLKAVSPVIHFTHAALIQPIIEYLHEQGVPVDEYLHHSGIPTSGAEEPTVLIPRKLLFQFVNEISTAGGIEDIGLQAGQAGSLHMMGEFGRSLLEATSIRGYLKKGCTLINAANSSHYYWLTEEPEQTRFCQSVAGLNTRDQVQDYLYISFITINTIREAVDKNWCPTEITIPGMSPATAKKLAKHLPGVKIGTQGEHASFTVPVAVLKHPMSIEFVPTVSPKSECSETSLPRDFLTSITQIIEILMVAGHPDIASVADVAEMTTRTLQRRLMDADISYTDLLAQTRVRLAKRWIADSDRSLKDISEALKYNDPSNFSRAFRRVTGVSPRTYRSSSVRALRSQTHAQPGGGLDRKPAD